MGLINKDPPPTLSYNILAGISKLSVYTRQFASSETDVAGFAQLQSFQSILLQEDPGIGCKGAPPRVNLYTGQYASSETDVAGFAQLKKEASISEITFYCQLVSTQSRVMITANASQ